MTIAYAPYELHPQASFAGVVSIKKRQGALLRIQFKNNQIGYADCHPWTELGDLSLSHQLKKLARGYFTPLTQCAWEWAQLDAQYRTQKINLFTRVSIPRSHFLILNVWNETPSSLQQVIDQGYTHIKLKLEKNCLHKISFLCSLFSKIALKLRIDFNEKLTEEEFRYFLKYIQPLKHQIEFIEDPFPFQVAAWQAIQKEGWRLACDRQASLACHYPEAADFLIVKPALYPFQEWQNWNHQIRIVTSYLGHPLGQMVAAYVAACLDPHASFVHGLLSHQVYYPTAFSQLLNWQSPTFLFPLSAGFGFDDELQQLEWKELR